MEDNKNKVIGAIILIVLILFLFRYSQHFSILDDPSFNNEINYSTGDITVIAKSTGPFFTNSTDSPIGTHHLITVGYSNIPDGLSLDISNFKSQDGNDFTSSGIIPSSYSTYLATTNLALNTSRLSDLSFKISEHTSLSCNADLASDSGVSSVYLTNTNNEILLWSSPYRNNQNSINEDNNAIIELIKVSDSYILSINGDKQLINVPSGLYDLVLYSSLSANAPGCFAQFGGSSGQRIELQNLNIVNINGTSNPSIIYNTINNTINNTIIRYIDNSTVRYLSNSSNQTMNNTTIVYKTTDLSFFQKYGSIIAIFIALISIALLIRRKK